MIYSHLSNGTTDVVIEKILLDGKKAVCDSVQCTLYSMIRHTVLQQRIVTVIAIATGHKINYKMLFIFLHSLSRHTLFGIFVN